MQVVWKKFSKSRIVSLLYLTRIEMELLSKFTMAMGALSSKILALQLELRVKVHNNSI
jgi:hypothetical protein